MTDAARRAYLDASAIVRLVVDDESEAPALRSALIATEGASSELAIVEVKRASARRGPAAARRADEVLGKLALRPVDRQVLDEAAALPGSLRSLDAIHLATALNLDIDAFISYDARLNEAASAAGLNVEAPA